MPADSVLGEVRVLDFGRYVAGPYCAALPAEFGTEAVRIEKPSGSEDRYLMPVSPAGDGALFMQMNRNKLSMTLDRATPEGCQIVKRLAKSADVVVVNLPASALEKPERHLVGICSAGHSVSGVRAVRPLQSSLAKL